jgi:hypothetical protein
MGWAFVLRHGRSLAAGLMFVCSCIYALGQLPAYLELFALAYVEQRGVNLEPVMYGLAVMKGVLAALGFLLFASPFWWKFDESGKVIKKDEEHLPPAEVWPGEVSRRLSPSAIKVVAWFFGGIIIPLCLAFLGRYLWALWSGQS